MDIPRVPLDAMPPGLAELLRPRVARLGYLGEFFQCAAHQPDALVAFQRFTDELKRALPDRLTELVALTVSTVFDNAYERHQHERLALKLGFGEPWIRDVMAMRPDSSELPEDERRVQALVLAVVQRRGHEAAPELAAVVETIGPAQAIAILMLVGRYVTHALMVNTLGLAPPVPSPLSAQAARER